MRDLLRFPLRLLMPLLLLAGLGGSAQRRGLTRHFGSVRPKRRKSDAREIAALAGTLSRVWQFCYSGAKAQKRRDQSSEADKCE